MACPNLLLLNWNVRGLNAPVRRCGVREMVGAVKATVTCLQETKLQDITESMVAEILGARFMNNFSFLPAEGTCGGILIAVLEDHFQLLSSSRSKYTHREGPSSSGCLRMDPNKRVWAATGSRQDHFS
jgi:exonuclease III